MSLPEGAPGRCERSEGSPPLCSEILTAPAVGAGVFARPIRIPSGAENCSLRVTSSESGFVDQITIGQVDLAVPACVCIFPLFLPNSFPIHPFSRAACRLVSRA
jgi:hypothetical protein